MRFFDFVVKYSQICCKLTEIRWLKFSFLEINHYHCIEFAVEEKKIWEVVMSIDFEMILVADECEVSSKCHNEVLDIVDNLFFYDLLINICCIAFSYFLRVDEVQEIFVLEHHDRFTGSCMVRDCVYKVVRDV